MAAPEVDAGHEAGTEMMEDPDQGVSQEGIVYGTKEWTLVNMFYSEVADGSGSFRGHYDLMPSMGNTVSVWQDGGCFWSSIAAAAHPPDWERPRTPSGAPMTETGNLDMQRADVETNAAIAIMEPYLQHLKQSGREDQVYGFRSGATLVESSHIQEIVDIIRVQVQVHQSNGATEVYEPAPHPDIDACDDSDPHASGSNAGTVAAVGGLDSMDCCPELARVGRWKLICKTPYARTCYGPPARRFIFN